LKKLIIVLAALLLVALPVIGGCGDDGDGLTEAIDHHNKGVDYFEEGRLEDAIAEYGKAIELEPRYAEAYNNRGFAHFLLDQHQRAIEDYDEAIRFNPQLVKAYTGRALAHTWLGNYQEAERDIDKAVELGERGDLLRATVEQIKAER
jgi:tetratricopeptide (TPR) repeat protein